MKSNKTMALCGPHKIIIQNQSRAHIIHPLRALINAGISFLLYCQTSACIWPTLYLIEACIYIYVNKAVVIYIISCVTDTQL